MFIYPSLPLKTGSEEELPVIDGNQGECSGSLDVQLLEVNELAFLGVPAVNLGEGVVAAQDGVLPAGHRKWLEDHGTSRRHGLDFVEHVPVPLHHLGVTNEACQADKQLALDLEVLNCVNVLHLWDVCAAVEQLGGFVPLVDDWPLGAAGQNQVRLARDFQVLHIGVAVPRVQGLVGVEAVAVPLVDRGGASFGAISDDEE